MSVMSVLEAHMKVNAETSTKYTGWIATANRVHRLKSKDKLC